MMDEEDAETLAQRWHDTEHGLGLGPPGYSSCWCCCTACDPDYGEPRANPYFEFGLARMRETAAVLPPATRSAD